MAQVLPIRFQEHLQVSVRPLDFVGFADIALYEEVGYQSMI